MGTEEARDTESLSAWSDPLTQKVSEPTEISKLINSQTTKKPLITAGHSGVLSIEDSSALS